MIRLIHSQLIGLRTLRSTYGVLAGIVGVVLIMVLADLGMASVGVVTSIIVCVFAAAGVAADYRYRTITQRVLGVPRRTPLLLASLVTYTAFALVTAVAAMAIAVPLASSKDLSLGPTAAVVAGPVIAVPLFAVIGVGLGTICRSPIAAVFVIIGWFPAEKLLALALGDRAAYLPYGLINQLLGLEGATLGRGTAALCLAGYATATTLVAAAVLTRRDIN